VSAVPLSSFEVGFGLSTPIRRYIGAVRIFVAVQKTLRDLQNRGQGIRPSHPAALPNEASSVGEKSGSGSFAVIGGVIGIGSVRMAIRNYSEPEVL
jgi:hypothetical protein